MRPSALMVVALAAAALAAGRAAAAGEQQGYQECMSSLPVFSAQSDVGMAKAKLAAAVGMCTGKKICPGLQSKQAQVSMAEFRLDTYKAMCRERAEAQKMDKQTLALKKLEQIELSAAAWENQGG